jgi:pimeloyl-ACP methyl ester carboxylesterase
MDDESIEAAVADIGETIESATATTTLPDSRTLAYAEFGDPEGFPVFVFHGGIGSRGFGMLFEDAASQVGARIVSPDRPGYGRSEPQPGRELLDWPDDVAALADDLDLESFGVLGVSGGGPFAAACAYELSDRLRGAALVSSAGPPGSPASLPGRLLMSVVRFAPWLARLPVRRPLRRARDDPVAAIETRAADKAEPEAAMWHSDAGHILTASTAEAARQGSTYVAREISLVAGPWGFELADIEDPVGLWYGQLDRTIPVATGEYLADAMPGANLTVHDDVGHLSLPVTYGAEILSTLLDPE